jgi:tetratricopeptide (TPR) repeat protein
MTSLEFPDRHHLNAATGWLELGNLPEAREELTKITSARQEHAEVLALRWHLHSLEKDWVAALQISRRHLLIEPESPEAWINQSFALHELQRTDEAFRELRQVVDRFAEVGTIPYNLACYTCRLGLKDEALSWLKHARKLMGRKALIAMASEDPDLEALQDELKDL